MSSSGTHPPAQQPRRANNQSPPALGGAAGSSGAAGAAAPIIIKPFKICKEATAEQRRAERQAHVPSAALRQEAFGAFSHAPLARAEFVFVIKLRHGDICAELSVHLRLDVCRT